MVIPRHIVNDRIEKTPILISYCPACRSGIIFLSRMNGKSLTFETQGVYRRNLVMRDRETNSLWQQATGEAICRKLEGNKLEMMFGEQMIWKRWKKELPDTLNALEPKNTKKSLVPRKLLMKTLLRAKSGHLLFGRYLVVGCCCSLELYV